MSVFKDNIRVAGHEIALDDEGISSNTAWSSYKTDEAISNHQSGIQTIVPSNSIVIEDNSDPANPKLKAQGFVPIGNAVEQITLNGTALPKAGTEVDVPLVSESNHGAMPKEAYAELLYLKDRVESILSGIERLQISFGDVFGTDTPTTQNITDYLETLSPVPEFSRVELINLDTGEIWEYDTSTDEFVNTGVSSVPQATNTTTGTVTGSTTGDGKVYVEVDNTMSLLGYDNKLTKNDAIEAGTSSKVTYDTKGLITGTADLEKSDIPNLDYLPLSGGTETGDIKYNITDKTSIVRQPIDFVKGDNEGDATYYKGSEGLTIVTSGEASTVIQNKIADDGLLYPGNVTPYTNSSENVLLASDDGVIFITGNKSDPTVASVIVDGKANAGTIPSVRPGIAGGFQLGSATHPWQSINLQNSGLYMVDPDNPGVRRSLLELSGGAEGMAGFKGQGGITTVNAGENYNVIRNHFLNNELPYPTDYPYLTYGMTTESAIIAADNGVALVAGYQSGYKPTGLEYRRTDSDTVPAKFVPSLNARTQLGDPSHRFADVYSNRRVYFGESGDTQTTPTWYKLGTFTFPGVTKHFGGRFNFDRTVSSAVGSFGTAGTFRFASATASTSVHKDSGVWLDKQYFGRELGYVFVSPTVIELWAKVTNGYSNLDLDLDYFRGSNDGDTTWTPEPPSLAGTTTMPTGYVKFPVKMMPLVDVTSCFAFATNFAFSPRVDAMYMYTDNQQVNILINVGTHPTLSARTTYTIGNITNPDGWNFLPKSTVPLTGFMNGTSYGGNPMQGWITGAGVVQVRVPTAVTSTNQGFGVFATYVIQDNVPGVL